MNTITDPNAAAGERRRCDALRLLEAHRERLINRGRRALLAAMLAGDGTATADDVRAAVPGALVRAGIIRAAKLRVSTRPERHAGLNHVWELADRAAALDWLDAHPDVLDPLPFAPDLFAGIGGGA